jgi:cytoskeleton protein RodZ
MSDPAPVLPDAEREPAPRAVAANDGERAAAPLHFGEVLATERQRRNLSVGDIAERLRLHSRQVAALEAAQLDALPTLTFVRGYVRTYAKVLGLEAEPLLADLNARIAPAPAADDGDSAGTTASSLPPAARDAIWRRVVLLVVVALLVLFALVGYWATRTPAPASTVAVPQVNAVVPQANAPAAAEPMPSPSPPVNESVKTPEPAKAAEPSAAAELKAPTDVKPAPPQSVPAKAAAPVVLQLAFRERAWVEVMQADGRVLLSQNNDAGTEQRLAGQPPYRLVIGNASAVSVQWRGQTVDLAPRTNADNVARVTLE